jgi:hypothetical protein
MTDAEKFGLSLPEHLRQENLHKLSPQNRAAYSWARQTAFITQEYERQQWRDRYLGWRPALNVGDHARVKESEQTPPCAGQRI